MAGCDGMVVLRRARAVDARGIAQVHVQTWRDTYRDLMPAPFLNALSVDVREAQWRSELSALPGDRRPWIAVADDEVIGFVSCGGSRDDATDARTGEIYALYVLPECWKKGVGRSLLVHAERDLVTHGYSSAVLWVLAENDGARAFYELSGWQADGATKQEAIGGRELTEVRYRIELERSRVAELV